MDLAGPSYWSKVYLGPAVCQSPPLTLSFRLSYWPGIILSRCIGQATQLAILLVRCCGEPRCIGQTTQLAILLVRSRSDPRCIGEATQLAILLVRCRGEPRCIGQTTQLAILLVKCRGELRCIGESTQLAILLVRSPMKNRAVLVKPLSWPSY